MGWAETPSEWESQFKTPSMLQQGTQHPLVSILRGRFSVSNERLRLDEAVPDRPAEVPHSMLKPWGTPSCDASVNHQSVFNWYREFAQPEGRDQGARRGAHVVGTAGDDAYGRPWVLPRAPAETMRALVVRFFARTRPFFEWQSPDYGRTRRVATKSRLGDYHEGAIATGASIAALGKGSADTQAKAGRSEMGPHPW